jgi:multisubunit Na+/H+ antiporter MnhC subunit
MTGVILAYLIIGLFSGTVVGILNRLFGGEYKDPAFKATLTALIWPVAIPLFFFLGLFSIIFESGKSK